MNDHHPIQCIIPPYITDRLAQSTDPKIRERAVLNKTSAAAFRAVRRLSQSMPSLMVTMAPEKKKNRQVFDAGKTDHLPGKLVRAEGQKKVADAGVNEAYDGAGTTYDFYDQVFQRNSLDDRGMNLVSSVHVAEPDFGGHYVPMDNAFWNGEQMVFGDGDGTLFNRFTISLDVIGHELTHGVTQFDSGLAYLNQPGALNESLSDVFGSLVKQHHLGQTADQADWLIGAELLAPSVHGKALRSMAAPGTAYDDPVLGKDPQPDNQKQYVHTLQDHGGVHINSGIPNHAFYLAATAIGGHAWERAGLIWYSALRDPRIRPTTGFTSFARATLRAAQTIDDGAQVAAVREAWHGVGINV